jgi:hypothetical protein
MPVKAKRCARLSPSRGHGPGGASWMLHFGELWLPRTRTSGYWFQSDSGWTYSLAKIASGVGSGYPCGPAQDPMLSG